MPEAKHAKSTSPLSSPVAEIFARSADQWFATQAALLADVDAQGELGVGLVRN